MSCPGCDNSSTTYTRCNPPVSTNCVFYQGETLTCKYDTSFQICKGDNLNDVQETIFGKICDITNEINVSSLNFTCSKTWGTKTDPQKTLKLLLSEITAATCDNATSIDTINSSLSTLNPLVTKPCLPCCQDSTCPTTPSGVVLLSEALANISECICKAKTVADQALGEVNSVSSQLDTLSQAVQQFSGIVTDYVFFKANVLCRLANLENKTNGMPCNPPCSTCVF